MFGFAKKFFFLLMGLGILTMSIHVTDAWGNGGAKRRHPVGPVKGKNRIFANTHAQQKGRPKKELPRGVDLVAPGKLVIDKTTRPGAIERLGGRITKMQSLGEGRFLVDYRPLGGNTVLSQLGAGLSALQQRNPRSPKTIVNPSEQATERFIVGHGKTVSQGRAGSAVPISQIRVKTTVLTGQSALEWQYAKTGWQKKDSRTRQQPSFLEYCSQKL